MDGARPINLEPQEPVPDAVSSRSAINRSVKTLGVQCFSHYSLEIHTGFPPGFFFVSKTCHDALSTINRDKVSVSVFFTFVTV